MSSRVDTDTDIPTHEPKQFQESRHVPGLIKLQLTWLKYSTCSYHFRTLKTKLLILLHKNQHQQTYTIFGNIEGTSNYIKLN